MVRISCLLNLVVLQTKNLFPKSVALNRNVATEILCMRQLLTAWQINTDHVGTSSGHATILAITELSYAPDEVIKVNSRPFGLVLQPLRHSGQDIRTVQGTRGQQDIRTVQGTEGHQDIRTV